MIYDYNDIKYFFFDLIKSSRDNRSGTSHPKSAGASMRRYNEQSHNQHIHELLETWQEHLQKCHLILYRVANRSKGILFGGRNPILSNTDSRVRSVPFSTRRPTFSEVKRVHTLLSQIEVHGMYFFIVLHTSNFRNK